LGFLYMGFYHMYTDEKMQEARVHAAKIERRCAAECFNPDFGFADHVTQEDKQRYREKQLRMAEEIEAGKHDHNFTIWQRMNTYLTGECVPFLSK